MKHVALLFAVAAMQLGGQLSIARHTVDKKWLSRGKLLSFWFKGEKIDDIAGRPVNNIEVRGNVQSLIFS